MHAVLYPKNSDSSLPLSDIVDRLSSSRLTSSINWSRGDAWVEEKLQELIAKDAPQLILDGHKAQFGRVLYLEAAAPQFPNALASCYVFGNESCIELTPHTPENLDSLCHLANEFSSLLDYDYSFNMEYAIASFSLEVIPMGNTHTSGFVYSTQQREAVPNWEEAVRAAAIEWLRRYQNDANPVMRPRDSIPNLDAPDIFAHDVLEYLRFFGKVRNAWWITKDLTRDLLIDHGNWFTKAYCRVWHDDV